MRSLYRSEQNRPSLWGIIDRPIAVVPDYTYSETLRQRKTEWQIWDEAALNVYLRNPREAVHGVKMFFKGLPEQSDRLDVISYLQTLK
jgi:cytochrome c